MSKRMETDLQSGLHYAAYYGHQSLIYCLINYTDERVDVRDSDGWTSLAYAVLRGNIWTSRCLVEEFSANCNVLTDNGCTLLHIAAFRAHMDVFRYFVKNHQLDLEPQEKNGWTPLHIAAAAGHLDLATYLVHKLNVRADVKSFDGQTPLHLAAGNGYLDIVQLLLEYDNRTIAKKDEWTPLHTAVSKGQTKIVQFLLDQKNYTTEDRTDSGRLPLHVAANFGRLEIVKVLVEGGTNLEAKDDNGNTPLILASKYDLEVVKYLVEKGSNIDAKNAARETPLHQAAAHGQVDILKILFAKGVNIDCRTDVGNSPLHYAVQQGCIEEAKYLILQGADIEARGIRNSTPLQYAAIDSLEMAKLLVEQGANLATQNDYNNAPIHIAARNEDTVDVLTYLQINWPRVHKDTWSFRDWCTLQCVKVLNIAETVKRSPMKWRPALRAFRENAKNHAGLTPLHIAVQVDVEVVNYLIEHGADIEAETSTGRRPLSLAVQKIDCVKKLVASGADCAARALDGSAASQWAAQQGCLKVLEYLCEFGIDWTDENEMSQTHLYLATCSENEALLKFVVKQMWAKVPKFLTSVINRRSMNGINILDLCKQQNMRESAILLVKAGGNPSLVDGYDEWVKAPVTINVKE